MSGGSFKIIEAVLNAYSFAGREARYLFKIGVVPLAAQLVTVFFVELVRTDASVIEGFLWGLPASALFGWFMFLEARFVFLGERIDRITFTQLRSTERQCALRISVLIFLLFSMSMTAVSAFMEWAVRSETFGKNALVSLSVMLCLGGMFWGVRFGVAHILAAINRPIRKFIFLVNGVEFSLRLIGMSFLCYMPIFFVGGMLAGLFIEGYPLVANPTTGERYGMLALGVIVSTVILVLINAAAAFALKEILGRADRIRLV